MPSTREILLPKMALMVSHSGSSPGSGPILTSRFLTARACEGLSSFSLDFGVEEKARSRLQKGEVCDTADSSEGLQFEVDFETVAQNRRAKARVTEFH